MLLPAIIPRFCLFRGATIRRWGVNNNNNREDAFTSLSNKIFENRLSDGRKKIKYLLRCFGWLMHDITAADGINYSEAMFNVAYLPGITTSWNEHAQFIKATISKLWLQMFMLKNKQDLEQIFQEPFWLVRSKNLRFDNLLILNLQKIIMKMGTDVLASLHRICTSLGVRQRGQSARRKTSKAINSVSGDFSTT